MKVPLWLDTTVVPSYHSLCEDLSVDVCIVGAGITGITLAYLLRDSGLKIALIDSDQVIHGTTAYTTAKLTAGQGLIYQDLIQNVGYDGAKLYYESQQEAIDFVAKTIHDLKIDCDFVRLPHYVFTQEASNLSKFEAEYEACRSLNMDCELVESLDLPFPIEKAIAFKNQAQFHPLKYLVGLLKALAEYSNISIYEHTTACEMVFNEDQSSSIITSNGYKVNAKRVVQACHFPFYDDGSLLFSKIEMSHSYLIAVENASSLPHGMYISYESPTRSIRTYQNFLLIGGENHRPGTVKDTNENYEALINFAKEKFQTDAISYEWSTQDVVSIDHMPYIGRLHKDCLNQFVATGYCKWGMSNGTAAALLLNQLIRGMDSPYTALFSPSRLNSKMAIKNLIAYNSKIAFEYIKGKLKLGEKNVELGVDEATIIATNEGNYGLYKGKEGLLYLVDITCPHLGCELAFNTAERTWDCPCHGSRFSYTGEVIEGPAHQALSCHHNKMNPNIFRSDD